MVSFDDVRESQVWSKEWDLPLVPEHNNPWIYCAYITKLLEDNKVRNRRLDNIWAYYVACEVKDGLINRHPDGSGGKTSHDELMGACYLHKDAAQRIYSYIARNSGSYNNISDDRGLKNNVYRFPWLMPYLGELAGHAPSIYQKLVWSVCCMWDSLFINQNDLGSKLKYWLMGSVMKRYWVCGWAYKIWKNRMASKSIALESMIKQELDYEPIVELSRHTPL